MLLRSLKQSLVSQNQLTSKRHSWVQSNHNPLWVMLNDFIYTYRRMDTNNPERNNGMSVGQISLHRLLTTLSIFNLRSGICRRFDPKRLMWASCSGWESNQGRLLGGRLAHYCKTNTSSYTFIDALTKELKNFTHFHRCFCQTCFFVVKLNGGQ